MSSLRMYPDWADLPTQLSAVIANRLTSIHDYLSFRGVCSSWRLRATFDNFDRSFARVPWLMYVTSGERIKGFLGPLVPRIANFYDVSMNKTYNFPQTVGRSYFSLFDVYLTHPMWRIRIELPSIDTFPADTHGDGASALSIRKMVLSNSPTLKSGLIVMVVWGKDGQLGFSRPGDSSWTVMDLWDETFSDIIYHNGRLYALDDSRRVVECDIHGPNPTQICQVFSLQPDFDPDLTLNERQKLYLVETSEKFLIISRVSNIYKTLSFKFFEFDLIDGRHNEVHDLGNKTLFLGFNSSLCVELSVWDEVRPNCIYFTDQSRLYKDSVVDQLGLYKDRDVNVYCLTDRSINSFDYGISEIVREPATWVVPSVRFQN
ncbi:hypothetical protein BUALT_Bualt10G0049900 [Buddleja alternifolia]|uniref:KIB1-4 beta-propeller domain-containing protein n=1 Tax=Buddleja alternifolia TaxID=168488 RepID=A0AAV6X4A7_9LAMI|nr:hypothetical protein BUALT_Bualt10G0049900 [Buddleja alternifolia]